MQPNDERTLADRISSLELVISDLTRRLDFYFQDADDREQSMRRDKRELRHEGFGFDEEVRATPQPPAQPRPETPRQEPRQPVTPPRKPTVDPVSVFQSKGAEWWLARGGGLLTLFALVLLYQYGVEHNWITPILRVAVGTTIGGVLMLLGNRMTRAPESAADAVIGLREILMGSALAAWYIAAYAAAVMYGLIPLSAARIVFLVLSIAGAWLALREKRALLGLFAVGVGFGAPFLLPSQTPSITPYAAYLGALTVVGLILYLMRGWQMVLWLTFGAFWLSVGTVHQIVCCRQPAPDESARIAMTILIVMVSIAMVRVPVLRRRLLALKSHLYTEPKRSESGISNLTEVAGMLKAFTGYPTAIDSAAVWVITLATPLLALAQLSLIWPQMSSVVWGVTGLGVAALAYRLASSPRAPDEEFTHVEAAATSLWSLAGILWLADGISNQLSISTPATMMIAASLHVFVTLSYIRDSRFRFPGRLAKLATVLIIMSVFLAETDVTRGIDPYWTFAEACGIAVSAWSAWVYRTSGSKPFAVLLAVTSYIALLIVDARFFGAIFRPLVTASYALMGTALVVASRNAVHSEWLRRAGGITLVIVVVRLLAVDMAGVETIWRVLLFLGVGALFLFASHRMQRPDKART